MQSNEEAAVPNNMRAALVEEVHLLDYLNVLRRRSTVFIAVTLVVIVLTVLYTFLVTPVYEASGTLHVRDEKGKVDLLGDLGLGQGSPIESEIVILKSRTNAEEVVRRLHLDWQVTKRSPGLDFRILQFDSRAEEPVYRILLLDKANYIVADKDGNKIAQGVVGKLLRADGMELLLNEIHGQKGDHFLLRLLPFNRTVQRLRDALRASEVGKKTNIIQLAYRNADPQKARDVVNTLAEVFLEHSVTLKTQEASRSLRFISEQLKNVRTDLDASEKQLEDFKSTSGMVQLDTEAKSFIERLAESEKVQAAVSIRRRQLEFAIESLSAALARGETYAPAVMADDPVVASMAQKLAEYEVQRRALLVDYTAEHPLVQSLERQIREVQEKLLATYRSNLQDILQRQAGLKVELAGYDRQLRKLPEAERKLAHLTRQAKVNSDIYTFLLQKHEEARILRASTMSNIDVIDTAIAPDRPVTPNKRKNLLLGLVGGLMLGTGLAFFLEYMDDTVKDPDQIKRLLGLPTLVTIPFLDRKSGKGEGRQQTLVSQFAPKAPAAEAFRSLRTSLHYSAINKEKRVLMVTSSFPGEGKTTVSANLAVTLAQTGGKVLLIGCDLRKPALHEFFDGHRTPGLTEVLAGDVDFEDAVNRDGAPGVDFLSSGIAPPNPAELLETENMAQLVAAARKGYDHVILDAPPMMAVTDAAVLSVLTDLTLVVYELGRNTLKETQLMSDQLAGIQAPLAGLVLNDKSSKGASYYGGYYGRYGRYGGYYGEDAAKTKKRWWRLKR